MIVLNTEKGFIQVDKWADIEGRAGFTSNLDPDTNELASILGSYSLPTRIRCGLSNCHTPHTMGYIAITKSGHETNIGNVCGKKYFGVDFETMTRSFDESFQEQNDRETLWNFKTHIDKFKDKVADLRKQDKGADWAHSKLQPFVDGDPHISNVVRKLKEMVRTGNSRLNKQREATEEEIRSLEMSQGKTLSKRPHIIDEWIGTIAGLEALDPKNDLKKLLVYELQEKAKTFDEYSIDNLTKSELSDWAKWVRRIDATFEEVQSALQSARRFLTRENLSPFLKIGTVEQAFEFQRYLKKL
jgi:hypothetical protein